MATQRCPKCRRQFRVPADEVGDHGCPNPLCEYHDLTPYEIGDEDEEDDI